MKSIITFRGRSIINSEMELKWVKGKIDRQKPTALANVFFFLFDDSSRMLASYFATIFVVLFAILSHAFMPPRSHLQCPSLYTWAVSNAHFTFTILWMPPFICNVIMMMLTTKQGENFIDYTKFIDYQCCTYTATQTLMFSGYLRSHCIAHK